MKFSIVSLLLVVAALAVLAVLTLRPGAPPGAGAKNSEPSHSLIQAADAQPATLGPSVVPARTAVLSEGAKAIIQSAEKSVGPTPDELKLLQPTDIPALIAEFDAQELTNRVRVLWAMAYMGGRQVCDKFIEALEADYQARELDFRERRALLNLAKALGLACQSDPGIFRYLTNHVTAQSWTPLRTWKGPSGPAQDPDVLMAGHTVIGVGLSGAPQARAVLEQFLNSSPAKLQDMGSAVLEGLFYHSMSQGEDRSALVRLCTNSESAIRAFSNWLERPEGKRYSDLLNERRDGKQ